MDFTLTDEQRHFKKLAKEFSEKELAPFAKKWDEECIFPIETLRKAAALGFASLTVDSKLSRLDSAIIFEELATGCVSTAAYLSIHNMVVSLIDRYANTTLQKKWLPRLGTMELVASYCLTEPNSGSDAASLQTTAKREGDYYIVNGTKAFISGGSASDIYVCMVKTGETISCLLIEKNTQGLSFGKKEKKLGWHSQPTTMVFFENCRVPVENLIGEEGQGFKIAMSALDGGRINIAACSLGGAKTCLRLTRDHMHERSQFKTKLADFEVLQFRFADLLTELESARLLVHKAAFTLDNKDPQATLYCAMAKRLATDNAFNISNQALQIFGGYGYMAEYPLERIFRDLRVHSILEGTNEIMRLVIAKRALSPDFSLE